MTIEAFPQIPPLRQTLSNAFTFRGNYKVDTVIPPKEPDLPSITRSQIQLPDDVGIRLTRAGLAPDVVSTVLSVLGLAHVGRVTRSFLTARARFTPPDAHGHMLWTGPTPANRSRPQIISDGVRMDAARFMRMAYGLPSVPDDARLERDTRRCAVADCYAPEHFLVISPTASPASTVTYLGIRIWVPLLFDLYLEGWPKPRSGKLGSYSYDLSGRARCPEGHLCTAYNGYRKSAYCAECESTLTQWRATLKAWNERVGLKFTTHIEDRILREYRANPEPSERVRLGHLWADWAERARGDSAFRALSPDEQYDHITGRVLAPETIDFSGMFDDDPEVAQG